MTKKIIIAIVLLFIVISIIMQSSIYAIDFDPDTYNPGSTTTASGADKLKTIGNNIIGSLKALGSIVSVVALIIMGIKYVMGSVEEKAEYKKTMRPYIIGAIMVFAITNLLGILIEIIGGF